MSHLLRNENIELHIDHPLENYSFSRFDWTGKIAQVKYKGIAVNTIEDINSSKKDLLGRGFYNEFGIESAIGFNNIKSGEWFHKIGVGLLQKNDESYLFNSPYKIKPSRFTFKPTNNKVLITCKSDLENGYAYLLKKEISLNKNGFIINYYLENLGQENIITTEYTHNFIAIDNDLIGENYLLKFNFNLNQQLFNEVVNPEDKVIINLNNINFKNNIEEQFFFSNLTGNERVEAQWEIHNLRSKIGIREKTSFKTNKINVWGWNHVISPELFYHINLSPNKSATWSRTYEMFDL